MFTKKLIPLIFVASLLLAACGTNSLTDEEFTAAARPTCTTLNTEVAPLGGLNLADRAVSYRKAAQALDALSITSGSAPNGSRLRTGLADLADASEKLAAALSDANVDETATLFITEEGSVYVTTGSVLEMTKLSIDPAIAKEVQTLQADVTEAATALGLTECNLAW